MYHRHGRVACAKRSEGREGREGTGMRMGERRWEVGGTYIDCNCAWKARSYCVAGVSLEGKKEVADQKMRGSGFVGKVGGERKRQERQRKR